MNTNTTFAAGDARTAENSKKGAAAMRAASARRKRLREGLALIQSSALAASIELLLRDELEALGKNAPSDEAPEPGDTEQT